MKKNKKVFLGGTCNDSIWRETIIPFLKIDYFNPVVDDWNEEAQKRELEEREICDYLLYVITPEMKGVYSIAEAVDDSNKRPEKTIFCVLNHGPSGLFDKAQMKSLDAVGRLIERNGGKYLKDLNSVVDYLNKGY